MILRQLQKAAGDAELMKQLEEEENAIHEFEYTYRALAREVKRKNKELEKKGKELDEKKRYIQELEERLREKGL
jgi:chromosome segregation ATPase